MADSGETFDGWVYGDAGDRYPIERRDIVAVGSHVLACGDVEKDHGMTVASEYGPPDLAYVDIPYDESAAKAYRTKAGLDNSVDFHAFLKSLAWTLSYTEGDVFVECGQGTADMVREAIRSAQGRPHWEYDITYYQDNPAKVVHARWGESPELLPEMDHMDDSETPHLAVRERTEPGDIVFDPCMGRGLTALAAAEQDRQVLGLELHPRRLAVTVKKLVNHVYESGERPRPDAVVARIGRLPDV